MTSAANVFLSTVRYCLGGAAHTVEESVAAGRTRSSAQQLRQAGFARHWICDPSETAYDLARQVVASMGDEVARTDAVVYATCLPANANLQPIERFERSRDVKHLMDFPVSRLQSEFDLDRAVVVGIGQQACTSMLGSLRLARALLVAEPDLAHVLCVTSDRFPSGAIYEQAYSLISDGAAGCLMTRSEGAFRLVATHHIANGAMVEADDDETVGAYFNYTHRLITELLAKARMSMTDVAWVLPQNTHVKAWEVMARLLRIDPARIWCPTLADVAHVISGDNLINLAALSESGRLEPRQRLVLVMSGFGMNWQAVVLEKT